jgi:hypothetical protein
MSKLNLIQAVIDTLSKPVSEVLSSYKTSAKTTLEQEVALVHPVSNTGVHVRSDNVLELFAGDTKIILDGSSSTIIFSGKSLVSSTSDVNFLLSSNNSFGINGNPINFYWQNNSGGNHKVSPLTYKTALTLNTQVLTGVPQTGQSLVSLSSLFDSAPLFLFQKMEVNQELQKILANLK